MRLLLTGPSPAADPSFQSFLRDADPGTEVISDALSADVLEQIGNGSFDGIVCRADGREAIHLVSRIRGRNTDVPIIVLAAKPDLALETEAIPHEVSIVVAAETDQAVLAENVRRLLLLERATRDFEMNARANVGLREELREAVLERKSISQLGRHQNLQWLRRGLMPLLIENDPEEAFTMVKAFEQAEMYAPLPIMRSAEEALAYLKGTPPFDNRNLHPLPGAILLDLAPLPLGIGLLRWIRQQADLSTIPVIVLSYSANQAEVQESYGELANSFLVKSRVFEELVSMIRHLEVYWTRMNVGRNY